MYAYTKYQTTLIILPYFGVDSTLSMYQGSIVTLADSKIDSSEIYHYEKSLNLNDPGEVKADS